MKTIKTLAIITVCIILISTIFYSTNMIAKNVKLEKELTEYSKIPILMQKARQLAFEAIQNNKLEEYIYIIEGMLSTLKREIELEKILDIKVSVTKEAKRLIIMDLILHNIDITRQLIEMEKMDNKQYNL